MVVDKIDVKYMEKKSHNLFLCTNLRKRNVHEPTGIPLI